MNMTQFRKFLAKRSKPKRSKPKFTLKEAPKSPIHHKTLASAIEVAVASAKRQGFEISEDEIFRKVTTAYIRKGAGKTNEYHLELTKGGVAQRKQLHIQVYNMDGGTYELNFYIS